MPKGKKAGKERQIRWVRVPALRRAFNLPRFFGSFFIVWKKEHAVGKRKINALHLEYRQTTEIASDMPCMSGRFHA